MVSMYSPRPFLDRPAARLLALLVALIAAGSLAYINRATLPGVLKAPAATANPELDVCLTQRIGAVDRMRLEKVIEEAQYDRFKARALAYCQTRFPPR